MITIKELKGEIKMWKFVALILIIASLIFALMGSSFDSKSNKLETKLSECKSQVPIWTLKVECIDHALASYIYFEDNYTDYELYQEVIERFGDLKQFENCEIIE